MLSYIIQHLFYLIPDSRFYKLKAYLLKLRGFDVGKNVRLISSVKIKTKNFSVGDNSFIGHETLIAGGDAIIKIGKNVDIGPRCTIISGTHEIGNSKKRAGNGKSDPIIIGNGTWVGANSTILGGAFIGSGCVVAAGSLILKHIDDNWLVGGVPAKGMRKLRN